MSDFSKAVDAELARPMPTPEQVQLRIDNAKQEHLEYCQRILSREDFRRFRRNYHCNLKWILKSMTWTALIEAYKAHRISAAVRDRFEQACGRRAVVEQKVLELLDDINEKQWRKYRKPEDVNAAIAGIAKDEVETCIGGGYVS